MMGKFMSKLCDAPIAKIHRYVYVSTLERFSSQFLIYTASMCTLQYCTYRFITCATSVIYMWTGNCIFCDVKCLFCVYRCMSVCLFEIYVCATFNKSS